MSTIVQTSYRPQIAPATAGLVANHLEATIRSRNVETAAGIGLGLAVCQGAKDLGIISGTGSTAFVGVTCRDVTLTTVPVDPLSNTANTVDMYGPYTNAAVISRGDVWVVAGGTVAAGNAAAFDPANGKLTTGTGGSFATGKFYFTSNPSVGQTIAVDGHNITFTAAGSGTDEVKIGPTLGDTVVATAAMINTNTSNNFVNVKAVAYPSSPGGAGEGSGANELHIAAAAAGANTYALSAGTATGVTVSAATTLGGTAASTAIVGGRWVTSAYAGELALLSLGGQ